MWTEAKNCPAEVVIGTPDKIPLLYVRFDSAVDCCDRSVEKTAAEITKVLILHIFSSACLM